MNWHDIPIKNKRFFWKMILSEEKDIALSLMADDEPTFKQLVMFLIGKKDCDKIYETMMKEVIEELKA